MPDKLATKVSGNHDLSSGLLQHRPRERKAAVTVGALALA
jgi:hypothetical protein